MKVVNKTKLEKLIAKLDAGKDVSLRDLQFNLGIEGLNKYNTLWASELERRKFFETKPKLIQEYDELVKQADFANNKYQPNTKHSSPTKHYQAAIELQTKIVGFDTALAQWFDRELSEVTTDVKGLARLVTSRSEFKLTSGNAEAVSKEAIKRSVLTDAVNKIEVEEKAFSESEDGKKLKLMLAKLKVKSSNLK
jgi:hypothetical protein